MLALTRKTGQRIHIGRNIIITIGKIWNGAAQVCIEAPPHVEIWREEVLKRKESKNENRKTER